MLKREVGKDNYGFLQTFNIKESDGTTAKALAGYTIKLKVWARGGTSLKFNGACSMVGDGSAGQCTHTVLITDYDTEGFFYGLVQLTKAGVIEDTETFLIEVIATAPAA